MVSRSTLRLLPFGAISLLFPALPGCNDPFGNDLISDHAPPNPPALPADAAVPEAYPQGPFGVTAGTIVENYAFLGFPDPQVSTELVAMQLGDFYNPHVDDPSYKPAPGEDDDRYYPPGSLYNAGAKTPQPKPRALFIDVASVWCAPCNQEAKTELPGRYAKYKPCGGQFLFQLAQGPANGSVATEQNLVAWTTAYKVSYPATIDMLNQLAALYGGQTFPDAVIIDTRTMKVETVAMGVPDDSLWSKLESMLTPGCLGH
jgi:hypothetical protein